MSTVSGFGPTDPGVPGGPPFAVTGPTTLTLDATRSGTVSFAVTNLTGRDVRARLVPSGSGAAADTWLGIVGEIERPIGVAGTMTVDVHVQAPADATAGQGGVVLTVALEDQPDQTASGPTAAFSIAAPTRRPFPWWIVIVAVVALLLVGGGITAIVIVTGDDDPVPTDPATDDSGPSVVNTGTTTVTIGDLGQVIDLDDGRFGDFSLTDDENTNSIQLFDVYVTADYVSPRTGYSDTVRAGLGREASYDGCLSAAFQQFEVASDPTLESVVCVRTNEGRLAALTLTPDEDDGAVDVTWTTWAREK